MNDKARSRLLSTEVLNTIEVRSDHHPIVGIFAGPVDRIDMLEPEHNPRI